jgi:hypothetical protein
MTREEAVKVYLDGLILKNVKIERFFAASRLLSKEDRNKIQVAIEGYSTNMQRLKRKEVMIENG